MLRIRSNAFNMKYYFLIILFIFNCERKSDIQCDNYYNKYIEASFNEKQDSLLLYIEKAVNCNPEDKLYRNEKLKILVSEKKYKYAIQELKYLEKDIYYSILKGLLFLKLNKKEKGNTVLFDEYQKITKVKNGILKENFKNFYYGLLITNLYADRESSLKLLKKGKDKYKGVNEIGTLNYTEKLIEGNKPIEVLNIIFNIRD